MVTRPPASIASAFFFCAVAACGAVEAGPRIAAQPPAPRHLSLPVIRPAAHPVGRTETSSKRTLFSTSTTTRTFTVMRPARAVVWSPHETASQGGTR
jgi:hypothetical protein